jgi:hypothetical protein
MVDTGEWFTKWKPSKREEILWQRNSGPIRTALKLYGTGTAMFGSMAISEQNLLVKASLMRGGALWIKVFLPMRWTDYARKLGYRASMKWETFKQAVLGQVLPLVGVGGEYRGKGKGEGNWPPGFMRDTATKGARVEAVSSGGRAVINIKIPFGHPVQPHTANIVTKVPPWELTRIAEEVGKSIAFFLKGGFNDGLSPTQRAAPYVPVRKQPSHKKRLA